MKKLLITGATGFVGRNLLLSAIRQGTYSEIVVPVRSFEKLRAQFHGDSFDKIPSNVRPVLASASDWKLENDSTFDEVIHCAGLLFGDSESAYLATNVEGTKRLLQQARAHKIIILSSQAAAGPNDESEVFKVEDSNLKPVTFYGKSKLKMEEMVAKEFSDLNYLIVRPPLILGPRDEASYPLFKLAKQPVQFKPGWKLKYYSFISVSDLVEAIFAALNSRVPWENLLNRIFFVAASEPITDRELLSGASVAIEKKARLIPVPQGVIKLVSHVVEAIPRVRQAIPTLSRDRSNEIWPDRWVISPRRFEETFSWRAKESLPQVLKQTSDWYRKIGRL